MKIRNFKTQKPKNFTSKFLLLFFLFFFVAILSNLPQSNANEFGINRVRTCDPPGGQLNTTGLPPKPEPLHYDVYDGGKDFSFDQSNGYCLALVLPSYASVKASIFVMNRTCRTTTRVPSLYPNPARDTYDIGRATISCPLQAISNPACCATWAVASAAWTSFMWGNKIQYDVAQEAFENTAICGNGLNESWMEWNSKTMKRTDPSKKQKVEDDIYGQNGLIAVCNDQNISPTIRTAACNNLNAGLQRKEFREWYYGGVERQDNGTGACPDVTRPTSSTDNIAGYKSADLALSSITFPTQKYYMRGTEAGNYACERFNYKNNSTDPLSANNGPLSKERKADYEYAYNCCINRSRTTICIERQYNSSGTDKEHIFCSPGDECYLGPDSDPAKNVAYKADYMDNQQLICARSYDLCPYNFNVGGGTLTCDYFKDGTTDADGVFVPVDIQDIQNKSCGTTSEIRNQDCSFNDKAGKCKNYCQYLNHCVVAGGSTNPYESSLNSPYFSQACIDFVGDSKNQYAYGEATSGLNISFTGGPQKHFSAPIVQCVKETLENIFYNRAGHSKCANLNEYPDRNGICFSGTYQYQKDKPVADQSFMYYLQDKLKDAIRIVLTISIMLQGFKMLLTGTPFKHSEIIMYVAKIGIVLFFATGTAWQQFFFNGIYNVSSTFSTMVMSIRTSDFEIQRDGCQFGKLTLASGTDSFVAAQYPAGKEYLSLFDTLDCKIARYLGFGPGATLANLAKMILPALLSPTAGAIGIFFAVFLMIFGILLIVVAIRSLHIFLASAFAIILLVYVSPITITMVLFNKTKPMFDRWLLQLMGYSLQPVFLFAYIGIFITVFETLVTGSATYAGKAPEKQIICDKACLYQNGTTSSKAADIEDCDIENGDRIINPMSDSIACIMNLGNSNFESIPVLQAFGLAIPTIKDFFSDEGKEKLLTLLKGLLVVYILAGFLGDIPPLSASIMGGQTLPTVRVNPAQNAKLNPMPLAAQAYGGLSAVTTRAARGGAKAGGSLKEGAKDVYNQEKNNLKNSLGKSGGGKPSGSKDGDNTDV